MPRRYWEIVLHLLIWIFVYLLVSPEPLGIGEIQMGGLGPVPLSLVLIYSFLIDALLVYSYQRRYLPVYFQKPGIGIFLLLNLTYLAGFVLFKAFIDWIFSLWVAWYIDVAAESALYYFLQGSQGALVRGEIPASFSEWLVLNLLTTAIVLFLANAYGFMVEWWKARNVHHRLEREKLVMELSALKHQINPHFLFNILNSLYSLALKNEDEPTANGIEKLSRMMRYVLYESNGESVTLENEVEYIENYIDLQRMRVGANIRISFTVDGPVQRKKIAPMLFIPFIENAFKHGISTAKESLIEIRLRLTENELRFSVTNPIHESQFSANKEYSGIGLDNVKKRLALQYPGKHTLQLEQSTDQYEVHLTLML